MKYIITLAGGEPLARKIAAILLNFTMLLIGLQILCGLLCINNANARTESSTDSHALTGSQEVLQA